jgi:hypothetical protein
MRNVVSVDDVHHCKMRILLSVAQRGVAQALPDRHDVGTVFGACELQTSVAVHAVPWAARLLSLSVYPEIVYSSNQSF